MTDAPSGTITNLLVLAARGDEAAAKKVWEALYTELRKLAAARIARERRPVSLQPTDLVHEAYLRLAADGKLLPEARRYLLGAAARAMYQIMVERARRRDAAKHGGGRLRVSLSGIEPSSPAQPIDALVVDEALARLREAHGDRITDVVVLRFVGGLEAGEVAELMKISRRTVERDWKFARAWLQRELGLAGSGS